MSSDDNSVRIHDYPDDAVRESSFTMKQLVHTLVRTGAFER
jgi:hypothetical protein